MLAYDTEDLSDMELAEILEFLAGQPQPTSGEDLYLDYCAACHGVDGAGGPTMRSVIGEAGAAERLVRNGHAGEFSNRREYMPKWSTDEISDPELDLIITYIGTL
jgi:mono/diheme cytochrome c family protein